MGLRLVLHRLKDEVGSIVRLSGRLGVSEKSVREWLKKSDEDLARLHPDNVTAIKRAAQDFGLDVEPIDEHKSKSLWEFSRSYEENLSSPIGVPPLPETPLRSLGRNFLGRTIASPFGPSSSIITANSSRISYLAHLGNDVLTYKTVRSRPYGSHPWSNAFFCDSTVRELDPYSDAVIPVLVDVQGEGFQPSFGMLNRYGMPSLPPEVWKADFRRAKNLIQENQVLILSVSGTASQDQPEQSLVEDFVLAVRLAVEAGAEVIELNLSCPNSPGQEARVFENKSLAAKICKAVRAEAPAQSLIAKIGYLPREALEALVLDTASYLNGYSAINTVPSIGIRKGLDREEPAFGGQIGLRAGLSGRPIIRLGLRCVESLAYIREKENMKHIAIIGMGGVTQPEDVQSYLDSGADVVQATTAFFSNPLFGVSVRRFLESQEEQREVKGLDEEQAARSQWLKAFEELERMYPSYERRITDAAVSVWVEWKQRFALERSHGGPRRKYVPDFQERIARRAGVNVRR